jgi:hypothetical protein
MTPEEQYDAAMKELDVKPGDLVVIERKVEGGFGGWNGIWSNMSKFGMDSYLGLTRKVIDIVGRRNGIAIEATLVNGIHYYFPPYCMRKATEQEIKEYEERTCSE